MLREHNTWASTAVSIINGPRAHDNKVVVNQNVQIDAFGPPLHCIMVGLVKVVIMAQGQTKY